MRKFTAVLCAAAMTLSMTATVFGNPSISTVSTDKVTVAAESQASLPEGMTVEVRDPDTAKYESKEAAEAVSKLNDDNQKVTMKDVLDILKVDPATAKTQSGNSIDPTQYEPVTKFADLVLTDGTSVMYDNNGEVVSVKVTLTLDAVKGAKADELVIMQIDPKTGEVYFIELTEDDFDPETGEITVTFPCLGPFTVLEKNA